MAVENKGVTIGDRVATASLAALQFGAVKVDASGQIIACSVAGEKVLGIVQNKPAAGEAAEVLTLGESKVRAGAAFAAGALLMTNAAGKLITGATAGSTLIGWAFEAAAAADEIVSAYINPATGVF